MAGVCSRGSATEAEDKLEGITLMSSVPSLVTPGTGSEVWSQPESWPRRNQRCRAASVVCAITLKEERNSSGTLCGSKSFTTTDVLWCSRMRAGSPSAHVADVICHITERCTQ